MCPAFFLFFHGTRRASLIVALLFPRYTQSAATRPLASAGPVLSLSPDMQRALHSDWMTSLQSVYQLVKARQCPFFYLLAPNFR